MSTGSRGTPRIGLALAGGGPLGAIHEIGALCALQDALHGIDFTRLQHYVGVSAGGFLAAGLANGMTPRQLCAGFIDEGRGGAEVFDPAWLMTPAWGEYVRAIARLPGLLLPALWRGTFGHQGWAAALGTLGPAIPNALFANEQVHQQLARLLGQPGRTNDFRRLPTRLTLVATDLDSGDVAPFGAPGWDHVPISRAVQATSALPGLFPPVEIDGRHYVDGALKKTLHASVALEDGVDLLLCVNPLVPFRAGESGGIPHIASAGLPGVLGQTIRTVIHSRMAPRMKDYALRYPGTDILLFEPEGDDPTLYLANTFGYRERRSLAEHAYQRTRAQLRARRAELQPVLARHGITLDDHLLDDPHCRLVPAETGLRRMGEAVQQLDRVLDRLARALPAQPAPRRHRPW